MFCCFSLREALANWLTSGEAKALGAGIGVELWRGAWRLVWAGSWERRLESWLGVMTEASARNSSSYSDVNSRHAHGDKWLLTVRMVRSDRLVIAVVC